jgi:hypothetical protein
VVIIFSVSLFLKGMANAQRVSKPVSNYGSEFEHIASTPWDTAKGIGLMGGRPVTIPADAQDMHELNDELFNNGDGSELSYGAALNNNPPANGVYADEEDAHDEIGSNEQEHASIAQQTPRQIPQQVEFLSSRECVDSTSLQQFCRCLRRFCRPESHFAMAK